MGKIIRAGRSCPISLNRCRPGADLAYLFNGAVNSIQITAPNSTSLGEP